MLGGVRRKVLQHARRAVIFQRASLFKRQFSSASALQEDGSTVLLRRSANSPGVATICLNSPRTRNALSLDMLHQLQNIVEEASSDSNVKVVVIEANSAQTRVFCSGHNLKEIVASGDDRAAHEELFSVCSDVMASITRLPKAVICKVDGLATAAGCQLVASCDMAFASAGSTFGTPGVSIGLFCSTPAVPIVRCVGPRRAMQMLLTGDLVSAEKAEAWGLVTEVVPADRLDAVVDEVAAKIASKSATAIAMGKRGFYSQISEDLDTAYLKASHVMVDNLQQHDAKEGIAAFLEKRPPHWQL